MKILLVISNFIKNTWKIMGNRNNPATDQCVIKKIIHILILSKNKEKN